MDLLAKPGLPDKPRLKGDDAGAPVAIGGLAAAIVERAERARKEAAAASRQLSLALEHAPELVRRHGLQAAHPRPLVSLGKRPDKPVRSFRVAPARAWRFPEVQYARAGSSIAAVALDLDDPAAMAAGLFELPPANVRIYRLANGHAHACWFLAAPVHCYPAAKLGPLRKLARIGDYFAQQCGADPAYNALLTHNPAPRYRQTEFRAAWGPERPYTLDELASVIPLGWEPPAVRQTGLGRQCDLWEGCLRWAGREVNAHLDVLPAVMRANAKLTPPLELEAVHDIAQRLEKYRKRWAANGWHSPKWRALQAARARTNSEARREGSNEAERPWNAAGISRRTWYRRRAER